jgi:hypothetical protein
LIVRLGGRLEEVHMQTPPNFRGNVIATRDGLVGVQRALIGALAMVMLVAASCSTGTDEESSATSTEQTTTTVVETLATDDDSSTTTTAGTSGSKSSKRCKDLEERDDGVYDLGEAGTVEVRRNGPELELVKVNEADGWTVDVDNDDEDDDEVEVDLRSADGTKVEFEAEIEDGDRLEIEVCTRS